MQCFYRLPVLCCGISEYLDEATLIPKNTSVLIRRVPGRPRMPIVTNSDLSQTGMILGVIKVLNLCDISDISPDISFFRRTDISRGVNILSVTVSAKFL
ncbi:putative DWNN domain-containing protein [Rosa chinensis]|uniref:Putative DWNN domain-containing protein n=1 Tax=Rosa chinensis TaxID=74649 RepID=A0A2P6RSA3_ROSCH|nr:putative DWNN domain-containing protein [Rosa chinensis]